MAWGALWVSINQHGFHSKEASPLSAAAVVWFLSVLMWNICARLPLMHHRKSQLTHPYKSPPCFFFPPETALLLCVYVCVRRDFKENTTPDFLLNSVWCLHLDHSCLKQPPRPLQLILVVARVKGKKDLVASLFIYILVRPSSLAFVCYCR